MGSATDRAPPYGWSPDRAFCLNKLMMGWLTPIVRRGIRAPLKETDLYSTPTFMRSSLLHPIGIRAWEAELKRADAVKAINSSSKKATASIWAVMKAAGRSDTLLGWFLLTVHSLLNSVVRPLLLREAVRAMSDEVSTQTALILAGTLSVVLLIESWSKVQGIHYAGDVAILKVISTCMQLISLKAPRLRSGASPEGYDQTLIGKDLVGAAEFARLLPMIVVCVVELAGGLTVLFWLAGPGPAFAGVGVMAVVLVGSILIARRIAKFNLGMVETAQLRVAVTREIIDGVKVVKMMGWEQAYLDHVATKRNTELGFLQSYRVILNLVINLGRASPIIATVTTCVSFSASGTLSADVIFPIISLFASLRVPFIFLPTMLQIVVVVMIGMRRVQTYLLLPEQQPLVAPPPPPTPSAPAVLLRLQQASIAWPASAAEPAPQRRKPPPPQRPPKQPSRVLLGLGSPIKQRQKRRAAGTCTAAAPAEVEPSSAASPQLATRGSTAAFDLDVIKAREELQKAQAGGETADEGGATAGAGGATAGAGGGAAGEDGAMAAEAPKELTVVLPDLSLALHAGTVTAVIGPVGCGKSTLLAAAWNEAHLAEGELSVVEGSVAVVPQRPFTIAGTLEDNIVTGRPRDEATLARVLDDCALRTDLAMMPLGIMTEVGERGVTLSGGQQQRIALARAMYGVPRLLLLDDPLSAVDTKTGAQILESLERYVHGSGGEGKHAASARPPDGNEAAGENGSSQLAWLKATEAADGDGGARTGGRAALIAINQMHHLRAFDRVLTLERGKLVADQTLQEILEAGGELAEQITESSAGGTVDELADEIAESPAAEASQSLEAAPAVASRGASAPSADVPSRLLKKEAVATGGFSTRIYGRFLSALGYPQTLFWLAILFGTYATFLFTDIWLTLWVQNALDGHGSSAPLAMDAPPAAPPPPSSPEPNIRIDLPQVGWIGIYMASAVSHVILIISTSIWFTYIGVKASRTLHFDCISRVIYAPISWYDKTPSGRVLSRFTSDLQNVDMKLTLDIDSFAQMCAVALCQMFFVTVIAPPLLVAVLLAVAAFCYTTYLADASIREVRRIANNAVSPIMSAISEARNGTPVIRAMRLQTFFAARQAANIEEWAKLNYYVRALQAWSGHVSSLLAFLFGSATAFVLLGTRGERSVEEGGLALTYALIVPYFVGTIVEIFIQMRTSFAALERLLEYTDIEQEPPHALKTDPPPAEWPKGGHIVFEDVSLRYRPGLPLSLVGFSAVIEAQQKVGIVGRTGAGKSTLILALFRLVEVESGTITIDGRRVGGLGLQALRRAMTIIPQDPVLHEGTVKRNLDPFGKVTDEVLRDVLRRARLPEAMLETQVTKGGANLSSGERQLLCFARALLESAQILILDEATSNLDGGSDEAIQLLLRSEFGSLTVLTIAHRLHTVIDYDALLVMGAGRLLESGAPHELLAAENGVLASMARALGEAGEAALLERSTASRTTALGDAPAPEASVSAPAPEQEGALGSARKLLGSVTGSVKNLFASTPLPAGTGGEASMTAATPAATVTTTEPSEPSILSAVGSSIGKVGTSLGNLGNSLGNLLSGREQVVEVEVEPPPASS